MKVFLQIFTVMLLVSQQICAADSCRLQLHFTSKVGSDTLELGKDYTNPYGELFSVNVFKYYLSGFYLIQAGSSKKIAINSQYCLIDERKPESKTITINIPAGEYSAIGFAIGVDSVHNVSGVQTGALDPINGMFWTWNTGYIMAKLEGQSPLSNAPYHKITYHIGGYKTGENTLRFTELPLAAGKAVKGGNWRLAITANINRWFTGKHEIKIAQHAFFMNPGPVAMLIADNYAGMFSVETDK